MKDQNRIHETPADRDKERQTLYTFCKTLDKWFSLAERHAGFDAFIYDTPDANTVAAVVEVKHRNTTFGTYPDYTIDLAKVKALIDAAMKQPLAVPLLIVNFFGVIYWCKPQPYWGRTFKLSHQKRRDRDEKADLVLHIPNACFVRIEGQDSPIPPQDSTDRKIIK